MVERLDTNVGRLVDAIEAAGQAEHTLIIFTSDNGDVSTSEGSPTTNAPVREGKGFLDEGGIRVPLIVSWPGGIPEPVVGRAPVSGIDVYPTVLAAAGVPVPARQRVKGRSILPALRRSGRDRAPSYWHHPHYSNQEARPAAAVRDGDLKLIRLYEDDHVELYDVRGDLAEQRDLARSPRHTRDRIRLQRMLETWLRDVGALLPQPNPHEPFSDLPGDPEYQS